MAKYIDADLLRKEIERRSHGEQGFNSEDAEYGYRSCARDLLSFLDTLSEEPDKVLEGEVILNGHGLLVDVTRWDNGYKLKVIIKEGEYEETIKED